MNATYKNEIFKLHPQERAPFENRCMILFMGKKLKSIFKSYEISFMSKLSDVLLNILYENLNVNDHYDINLDKYIIYS